MISVPHHSEPRPARRTARLTLIAWANALLAMLAAGCEPGMRFNVDPAVPDPRGLELRAQQYLLNETGDEASLYRMNAIEALQDVAPREGAARIRTRHGDAVAPVRFAALMATGVIRDSAALPAVRQRMSDANPNVRVATLFALHRLGDTRRSVELAGLMINHASDEVRANAALAIGLLGDPKAVGVLKKASGDRAEMVRLQATESMAMLGDKKAIRELVFAGNGGVGPKMVRAIMALGTARAEVARELFAYRLKEGPYDEVRLAAARGLGRLGDRRGLDLALRLLGFVASGAATETDPLPQQQMRMRVLACAALEAIGDAHALAKLMTALDDPTEDPAVRIAAARAIVAIRRGIGRPNDGGFWGRR
ncbi:MAG: HEAT repeat domain-containing protein [Phycisphaerae bacterium]